MSRFATHKWFQLCSVLYLFQYIYCDCDLPALENFPNGRVVLPPLLYENETTAEELSVIQFICSDEYLMIGQEYIQCFLGNWTDGIPFCAGLTCSDPPEVENAMQSLSKGLTAESVVEYTCNEGYEMEKVAATSLQCFMKNDSDRAVWMGELPHCIAKTSCIDPGVSRHGRRRGECCDSGDVLEFSCKKSTYKLVGESKIQCLRSGRWSADRPLCKPPKGVCELPHTILHGEITGAKIGDYFVHNQKAYIVCDPGYKVNGTSESKCLKEGWDNEFGTCEEVFCSAPQPIEHGTIPELKAYNDTTFPYKYEITYVCDKGYRLQGESLSTCDRRGWSGKKRQCVVVKCPDPGNPDNGMKHGSNYSVGSKISFSCSTGYELLGSIERYCLPNGQWDGELARCNIESNHCPDPGTPIHGSKNRTEYQMGDRVRFQCSPRHRMSGSEIRECLPNGTWSGRETKCLSYDDFDDDRKVSLILKNVITENAAWQETELNKYRKAVGSLNDNRTVQTGKFLNLNYNGRIILYFVFDVSGSVGQINLNKSIEFAKAIVKKVGISSKGAHASALQFSSKAEVIFWPMTLKTTEEVLKHLNRVNYTGGGTSASSALKVIRENHIPLIKANIKGVKIKHVLFIMTDGRANMGGDPAKEANLLKAEGVEIFCIGITGDVKQKVLYDIASSSTYGKDEQERPNVFLLQSYDTLAWLVHEITNGTVDYSECGVGVDTVGVQRGKILGGDISKRPWPWMAALYMTIGEEIPAQWSFQCGGSIIHPRFILTAAHCVVSIDGKERKPKEINVKLGLTSLKNETYLQEFEVRKIIYHVNFTRNYDSDIALLELNRRIEFNRFIRPICLPPKEKGELYKPESTVWATGWGDTKRRSPEDNSDPYISLSLKEVHLPIQARETCKRSLQDNNIESYFTDRMFCAGTGKGKNDTCPGDSGGPVMQSAVNKDGYPIWVQIGIISWGLGCGQKAEYGFYTHVHELMPWIEKEMNLSKNP